VAASCIPGLTQKNVHSAYRQHVYLCVLCGSQNKQQFFSPATLHEIIVFYNPGSMFCGNRVLPSAHSFVFHVISPLADFVKFGVRFPCEIFRQAWVSWTSAHRRSYFTWEVGVGGWACSYLLHSSSWRIVQKFSMEIVHCHCEWKGLCA
jgi:hypothetical protein